MTAEREERPCPCSQVPGLGVLAVGHVAVRSASQSGCVLAGEYVYFVGLFRKLNEVTVSGT